jgi:hypothetical protein
MLNKSNPVAQKQVSPNKGVVIASMAIILNLALYGLLVYSFVFGSLDPEEIVQAVIFALMFPIFSIGFVFVALPFLTGKLAKSRLAKERNFLGKIVTLLMRLDIGLFILLTIYTVLTLVLKI